MPHTILLIQSVCQNKTGNCNKQQSAKFLFLRADNLAAAHQAVPLVNMWTRTAPISVLFFGRDRHCNLFSYKYWKPISKCGTHRLVCVFPDLSSTSLFAGWVANDETVLLPYEPLRQKTYLRACAPSEDSDQTAHSRSLIRIFTGRILNSQGCNFLRSDNEDSNQTALMRRLIWVFGGCTCQKVRFLTLRLIQCKILYSVSHNLITPKINYLTTLWQNNRQPTVADLYSPLKRQAKFVTDDSLFHYYYYQNKSWHFMKIRMKCKDLFSLEIKKK